MITRFFKKSDELMRDLSANTKANSKQCVERSTWALGRFQFRKIGI